MMGISYDQNPIILVIDFQIIQLHTLSNSLSILIRNNFKSLEVLFFRKYFPFPKRMGKSRNEKYYHSPVSVFFVQKVYIDSNPIYYRGFLKVNIYIRSYSVV